MSMDSLDILSGAADPRAEALAAAAAAVRAAIAKLEEDPGAHLTDEVRQHWAWAYDADLAEFERLRSEAKKAGARVTEIDKLVGARNKHVRERKNGKTYSGSYTSDPSDIRAESFRDTSGKPPKSEVWIASGALVAVDDNGKQTRIIESHAADVVAKALVRRLAWDGDANSWLAWAGTHWDPQNTPAAADRLIADAVHDGTDPIGYRVNYLNGVTQVMQRRGMLAPPAVPSGLIPFSNGLLDQSNGSLTPATPDRAMTWCLPHDYADGADCPAIRAWLLRSVEGDGETVELLRAWLAALMRGLPLQKFLMLLGRGGSGKGTFQRLATALVGVRNVAVSTLRDLEENRFETAKLFGKRLCSINEAGRHGGALNMLKAITGDDHIPLERKHVQQSGTFVFDGLVLMATNEDLQSSDATSGLERRRITVRFPVSATPAEKADWESRGGEEAVLHREIPGLVNWLLELSVADIRARIERLPARVAADNLLGMAAGNSVADWLLQCTAPAPGEWTQIGVKGQCRDKETGKTYFEHADDRLFPSYLTWCEEHGRSRPVSVRKFRDTLTDMAETLGHPVEGGRHPVSRAYSIKGLRLLRKDDPSDSEGTWGDIGRIEIPIRKDRKYSWQDFVPENPEKGGMPESDIVEVEL